VLGVGHVSSVGKCQGCTLGDRILNLQFNTKKRTLKVVRREGNPTVRQRRPELELPHCDRKAIPSGGKPYGE
jgi:hypothetical protein